MSKDEERTMILKMLQDGKISVDETDELLRAVDEQADEEDTHRRTAFADDESETKDECRKPDFDFSDLGDGLRDIMRGVADGFQQLRTKLPKDRSFRGWVHSVVGKTKHTSTRQLEHSAEGLEKVQVKGLWGDLRALGGDDERITIAANITAWGSDEEDAQQTAESLEINLESSDGELSIGARLPDGFGARRYRVDYDIVLPARIHARMVTKSGDVTARGIGGGVELSTLSGDITAGAVVGDAVLTSKSGDIEVESAEGDLTLSTLSGDLRTRSTTGHVRGDTKSGDVRVSDHSGAVSAGTLSGDVCVTGAATGQVTAKTLSGDVELSMSLPEDPKVLLQTRNGDIRLRVPAAANANISARTAQGSIDCRLPLQTTQASSKNLEGILGSGGGSVEISTSNGDVSIAELEG